MGRSDNSELVSFQGDRIQEQREQTSEVPAGQYFHGLIYQPDCHLCPLRYQVKVLPDGPIPAKRVFVGEEPGEGEILQGKGFTGPSGKLLWWLDAAVGNPQRETHTWVTNAALCKAVDIKLTTGAILSKAEVKLMAVRACRRRLIWELRYVTGDSDTAVIQPLGKWALWSLTGMPNPKIYAHRGSVRKVDLIKLSQELGDEPPKAF